jgi:YegS/Rv2252/BmrU family lipid kinase
MTAKVILNPYAGRWKALKMQDFIKSELTRAGIDYDFIATDGPSHGTELAAEAVRAGYSPIISAGGDGSISEVVNGMVQASLSQEQNQPIPLGILPLGSANDLVVNLKLPLTIPEAVDVIARGNTRRIDIGEVKAWNNDKSQVSSRFFDNNSAIGLEPSITLIQQRIKFLHGPLRYLLATLLGVLKNPQWTMQLEWDDGNYQGAATLVTVGNNPLTGGLFYMTPHADPSDGLLTFVYGAIKTRRQILQILPRTMKTGPQSYVEHPLIHEFNGTWLRIHSDQPTPVHADGEIMRTNAHFIEYRVLPYYLSVLASGRELA